MRQWHCCTHFTGEAHRGQGRTTKASVDWVLPMRPRCHVLDVHGAFKPHHGGNPYLHPPFTAGLTEAQEFIQGHRAEKWKHWDLNAAFLFQSPCCQTPRIPLAVLGLSFALDGVGKGWPRAQAHTSFNNPALSTCRGQSGSIRPRTAERGGRAKDSAGS